MGLGKVPGRHLSSLRRQSVSAGGGRSHPGGPAWPRVGWRGLCACVSMASRQKEALSASICTGHELTLLHLEVLHCLKMYPNKGGLVEIWENNYLPEKL